jgi:iron complex transport system permease protein
MSPSARRVWAIAVLAFLALAASLFIGRYPRAGFTPPSALFEEGLGQNLILHLRLPRILAAFLVGAVLSAAGMTFQMIFRNPLVDSGFLGVSQGASFGAALAIVFSSGAAWAVQTGAAVFAFLGLAASYAIAHRLRLGGGVFRLVLAGIAVGSLFAAGTGILKYVADPQRELPDITFWMLGGLWGIGWSDVLEILPLALLGLGVVLLMRWRLNILSLRDETAFSLGVSPGRERLILLGASVAATAVCVSKAGQIAWVGLIVPHIARRLVGSDARRTIPASILFGGLFVLACDDVARAALSGEIPLGILTSLVGTLVFLGLLLKRKIGAQT